MTEKDREYQLMIWRINCRSLEKMIASDYPPVIKAHLLMRVFLPRLIDLTECTEFIGEQLASMIANSIAHSLGNCLICKKNKATDFVTELCPKCSAEVDQYTTAIETHE